MTYDLGIGPISFGTISSVVVSAYNGLVARRSEDERLVIYFDAAAIY